MKSRDNSYEKEIFMFCNSCGTEVSEFARVCPNCGKPTVKVETREVLGTKWADFLGYFYFWIGCLFSLIGIARLVELSGRSDDLLGGKANLSGYITVAVVLGLVNIVLLAAAAVAIINRKRSAGKLVCAVFGYEFVSTIILLIYGSSVVGVSTGQASDGFRMIFDIVLIFVNAPYFDNRSDVFVN